MSSGVPSPSRIEPFGSVIRMVTSPLAADTRPILKSVPFVSVNTLMVIAFSTSSSLCLSGSSLREPSDPALTYVYAVPLNIGNL